MTYLLVMKYIAGRHDSEICKSSDERKLNETLMECAEIEPNDIHVY